MDKNDPELNKKIKFLILEKFNYDYRKAAKYAREQARKFAHKADRKKGTPYYERWSQYYLAYQSAAFSLDYYLQMKKELAMELARNE